jgi:hypothetical protein
MKRFSVLLLAGLVAAGLANAFSLNGLECTLAGEAVPEPATLAMVSGAVVALATLVLKRSRSRHHSRTGGAI